MSNESAVILSQELINKIDEYRGKYSQQEYIRLCVDARIKQRAEDKSEQQYATIGEFQEFQEQIKDLERRFIEFAILYMIQLAR